MEIIIENYKIHNTDLNFSIRHKEINGIYGELSKELENILSLKSEYEGKIIIDSEELKKNDLLKYKKRISIVKEDKLINHFTNNIYELMYYEIRRKRLILKNPNKKIIDSLKIVGLEPNLINRRINTLSYSEKKLLQLAMSLLSNPDLIMVEEPFKGLDKTNEKKISMLFQKIKEQYNKTIIFISEDINMLYKYTKHIIITKKSKILIEGKTDEVLGKIPLLKKNKIDIPPIVEITYLAQTKKDIKLEYHKDIRDIIKDIYKHV